MTAFGRPDRCPTCDSDGPDRVDEDHEGGVEMACGDDWHDGVTGSTGGES